MRGFFRGEVVWAASAVLLLVAGAAAAGEVAPDDPRLVAFRDALDAERNRTGAAPTVEAYYASLKTPGVGTTGKPLDEHMVRATWSAFRDAQKPAVSLEQMAELARRRRDALRHVRITYRTERTGRELTPKWSDRIATECRFVRSDSKLFFEERTGGRPGAMEECRFDAYDGKVVRERRGAVADGGGFIRPLNRPDAFFDDDNPLVLSRALDSRMPGDLGRSAAHLDLARAYELGDFVVQERLEMVNGRECLLVASPFGWPVLYVDPKVGCGLVRYEDEWFESEPDGPGKFRLVVGGGSRVEFLDYREVDGVWIPFRILRKATDDASVITVESCEVGRPMGAATFANVFPASWTVQDHVRGGYVQTWPFGIEGDFRPF